MTKDAVATSLALLLQSDKSLRSAEAPEEPPPPPTELLLDTRFADLTLVDDGGSGSPDKYYVFDGTDTETGQVFSGSLPRLWGGELQWQVIGGGAFTADQMFTLSMPTGADDLPSPGTCMQVVRNEDYAGSAQAALKFLPTNGWALQGMCLIGFRIRLPSGFATTTNQQFTLMEIKSQGGGTPYPVVHLLATREDNGGTDKWMLKLAAVDIGGPNTYETWGDLTTATATCTPTPDAYYDGKFFSIGIGDAGVTTIETEKWYTIVFGFRLKDHAGNVAGGASDGWVGVWSAGPNVDGSPKDWDECALRMLVTGRNLGYVTGPSADYVFVLNHYNAEDSGVTDEPFLWADLRVDDEWWTDFVTMPAAVDAIENPGGAASAYRNPWNESAQYLQGNTTGNGVESSSTTRAMLARFDIALLQWKWPDKQDEEIIYIGQIRAVAPHIKLIMYTDPQFYYDSDLFGGGTTTVNYTVTVSAGAPDNWKIRDAGGNHLAHTFSPNNTRRLNWANVSEVNTAGKTLRLAWCEEVESYFNIGLYDGINFDDANIIPNNACIYGGGGATVNWDYDRSGSDNNYLTDDTFKLAWATGMRALFDEFLTRNPTMLCAINTDPTYWYRQTAANGCPQRPLSSHPYYHNDDTPFCEGHFQFAAGLGDFDRTDDVYPVKGFFGIEGVFLAFELYRQIGKPAETNKMGRTVAFAHSHTAITETATPSALTYAFARSNWAMAKLCGGGYATSRSGAVPFPLDELCIELGEPVSTLVMGTLDQSNAPVVYTMRSPNYENGAADFYWAIYENALVVVRLDHNGLTPGSSNFGDGSAVSCVLPSAGSGYQWDEFNAATYEHPTIADLFMEGQDTSVNGGASNVTSVSLKPLHGKAFRKVAAGGGGGAEDAPVFIDAEVGFTSTDGDSTCVIDVPTHIEGDELVLGVIVNNNSTAGSWGAVTWPSGYVEDASVEADAGAWNKLLVARKTAGGSEPSTVTVTYGETGGPYRIVGILASIRGCDPASILDAAVAGQNNPTNTTSCTAPSRTPSDDQPKLLLTFYGISDGNARTDLGRTLSPPGGQTERAQVVPTSDAYSRLMLATEEYQDDEADPTGTRVATITSSACESMAISMLLRGVAP